MSVVEIVTVVCGSIFLVVALTDVRYFNPYKKAKLRKGPANSSHRSAMPPIPQHRPAPIPLPPSPAWYTQTKTTINLPGVYKDEVDGESAIESVTRMAKDVGMSNEEILKMVDVLKQQLRELPEKPSEENDTCPECGSLFALVDDYLCPECRAAT